MKTILIIDDEAAFRLTIGTVLRRNGYATHEVGSGAEGLALARTQKPDMVLTDVNMNGLNGLGVLQMLRSEPALAAIPVILMSGMERTLGSRAGMELGADDFLSKPFRGEVL